MGRGFEIRTIRTDAGDPGFRALVRLLDAELAERDGEDHAFYNQYNGLAGLDRVVLVVDRDRPVGCGALKAYGKDAAEVKRMFTLPEYRGRGVAGRVLGALEDWAARDGLSRLVLETGKRQPEAIALYRKHGYSRIGNFGPYIGVDNSVCFEKHVGGSGAEAG